METFYFYVDQKQTIWERAKYAIDAESEDEAIKKATRLFSGELPESEDPDSDLPDAYDYEMLVESAHNLKPEEDNYNTTRELISTEPGEEVIIDNDPKILRNPKTLNQSS